MIGERGAVARLRDLARRLRRDVVTLWLAARDPRVPLPAKLLAGAVAAYALSPIDLIPDFIPVIGYLDDLLIVPAGIWFALRLIPGDLLDALRRQAAARAQRPTSRVAAAVIILFWIGALIGCGLAVRGWWHAP